MDFSWTEEQARLYNETLAFAKKNLGEPLDNSEETFRQKWKECADYGIQGIFCPEQYGGAGLKPLSSALVMQALGYASKDMGFVFSLSAHIFACLAPILEFGNEVQKQKYLPGLIDGSLIAANCISEPNAGSDAFALATTAVQDGNNYILNGSKSYATNAPMADIFLVYATTGKTKGIFGINAFIVERNFNGISNGHPYKKIGLETSPLSEVFFDDCRVPIENRLSHPGAGAKIFNLSMDWERSCLFASYLGFMERQLELCIDYAKTREQFGKSISKFQAVSHKIVDMKIRLEAAKLLLYKAVSKLGSTSNNMDAAIAKLYISESAVQSSLDAIQLHGAYGIMKESGIERYLRDAVPATIFSGTSEIQRNIIARCLKLPT